VKKFAALFISSIILASYSGKSEGDSSSKVKLSESSIDVEAVKKVEAGKINSDLNTGTYSLTLSELNELKTEGVLSEEDFQELSKLALN